MTTGMPSAAADVFPLLQQQFGEAIRGATLDAIDPWIEVAGERLVEVCLALRDAPAFRFEFLNCLSGVDYSTKPVKKGTKLTFTEHVEVVYHLTSFTHRKRLVLKVVLPRWKDDAAGHLPTCPSVAAVWRTAEWHEREIYDLVGVEFTGHPDLRRILCPDDWVGHPLRKDYEMPLEYHDIRGR
ncbi:MAG TPA: NADH-quinone oxidoreductase subunit C [Pirellulales bacterium]